jgi:excinuclease ABC subunit C
VGLFLQGKKKRVIKELTKQMNEAAKDEQFEYAATLRNRIFALEHIRDVSLIKNDLFYEATRDLKRVEAYDVAHMSGRSMTGVMTVVHGSTPDPAEYRQFNIRSTSSSNDPLALGEVLIRRFKHKEWPMPDLIVMDGGEVQLNVVRNFLKSQSLEHQIDVVSVVKDERHKPKDILGEKQSIEQYGREVILLANSEAHRFSIKLLRQKERKQFIAK